MLRFVPLGFVLVAFIGTFLPYTTVSYKADESVIAQATLKVMQEQPKMTSENSWNYTRSQFEKGPTGVFIFFVFASAAAAALGAALYLRRWISIVMTIMALLGVAAMVAAMSMSPEFGAETKYGVTVSGVAGSGLLLMLLGQLGVLAIGAYSAVKPQSKPT